MSVGLGVHGTGAVLPILVSANRVEPRPHELDIRISHVPPSKEVRGCVPASECRECGHMR